MAFQWLLCGITDLELSSSQFRQKHGKVTHSSCQVVLAFNSAKRESKTGPLNPPSPSPLNGKYQDIKSLLVAFKLTLWCSK